MRVPRYWTGTKSVGITYAKKTGKHQIQQYTDSEFVGDCVDLKSTRGYTFLLSGGAISWRGKKKNLIVQSTQKTE